MLNLILRWEEKTLIVFTFVLDRTSGKVRSRRKVNNLLYIKILTKLDYLKTKNLALSLIIFLLFFILNLIAKIVN